MAPKSLEKYNLCKEKLKIISDNLEEIIQISQDALEDAEIFGMPKDDFKRVLITNIEDL